MTDPANAEEIARTTPDFMGFIFCRRSKRYVGDKPEFSLFGNAPPGILKIGVFVNEKPSVIAETMKFYGLDLVQLHGNESVECCISLKESGLSVIKAFEICNNFSFIQLNQYMEVCEYFLFDTKTGIHGGSGQKFNWNKINEYHLDKPFFLGGGIGPGDASLIKQINEKPLFAVDINSRFEIRPGIKDSEKVKEFIKEIKG